MKTAQDYDLSRAHGGSMIVHIKTLLFNGKRYKMWNHSNQYDINFIARFVSADKSPDAVCTRERQTHTIKVHPIKPKYKEVGKEHKWKALEPGIWNVSVRVFDASRDELLANAKTDVTVKYDEVVTVNFVAGSEQSSSENPDDYFTTLKLKNIKYHDEDSGLSQLEITDLDWDPNPAQAGKELLMKANVKNTGSKELGKLKTTASIYVEHLDDVDDSLLNLLSDTKRTKTVYDGSLQIGLQPGEEDIVEMKLDLPENFKHGSLEFSTAGTYELTIEMHKGKALLDTYIEEDFIIVKTASRQSKIKTMRKRPKRKK